MRSEWPQVARHLLVAVSTYGNELSGLGLSSATHARIAEAFRTISAVYEVRAGESRVNACVADGENRATFLDSLFQHPIPFGDSTLFETIVRYWADEPGRWERAANLLDFFVHLDWSVIRRKVYESSPVLAMRRDRELCRRCFQMAEDRIRAMCPPEYYSYLVDNIVGRHKD